MIIGSKLDADPNAMTCRIAFRGVIDTVLSMEDNLNSLKLCKRKIKTGLVDRVANDNTIICSHMFNKETKWDVYIGMKVLF